MMWKTLVIMQIFDVLNVLECKKSKNHKIEVMLVCVLVCADDNS